MRSDYEAVNLLQKESENDPFTEDRYVQFARLLPESCRNILDVGCNTGRGGVVLKRMNPSFSLCGLDCVESRLERLPESYTEKLLGISTEIPTEDEKYDAITAGEFIEHLTPLDVDRTLCEFFRVLKVGGRLLLTTPNPSGIMFRLRKKVSFGWESLSQHHADCLRLRLRMTGFSNVKIYGSGKSSRYIGTHFPLRSFYGSYLISATKW
ncbi:MAG: class I SAM-dependent methyltransferase [Kiritimatiellales bacterium]